MLLRESAKKVSTWINDWNFEVIVVAPLALLLLGWVAYAVDPGVFPATLAVVIALTPLWLPWFLFIFFWSSWIDYIRYRFWFSALETDMVLLEIELPAEVEKSPLAMELFLTALWNAGGETTFIKRVWLGQTRPVWTFEIASNEGRIGFYLHLRRSWKNIVESRLYGQFPEAKITEVPDYVSRVPFNLNEYMLWGCEFQKKSPEALPIKTYVDYGLDKSEDQEYRVDPLTNILELLGSIGKDEYYWLQIMVRAHKKDEWYGFYTGDHYKDEAQEEIKKVMGGAAKRAKAVIEEQDISEGRMALLSEMEKRKIEAMERSLNKLAFDCGFRTLYLTKKERFNGVNIGAMIRFFDAFRAPEHNALGVTRGHADFDYPWQDFRNIRQNAVRKKLFFRYKHRAYFYVPIDQVPVVLSTEELATLWHFPGSIVKTPSLQRVPSRRAEAPPNLPVLPT